MDFQWYPGHMTKAKRMMQENMKLIDIMIELVDARIPLSSRNPDIDQLAANKSRLILLNKTDMADERVTAQWEEYFKEKGFYVARTNARSGKGVKGTQAIVMDACKEKLERDRKRGIKNRPIRVNDRRNPKRWKINIYTTVWLEKPVQKQEINQELQKETVDTSE